jgi:hypothetical protein
MLAGFGRKNFEKFCQNVSQYCADVKEIIREDDYKVSPIKGKSPDKDYIKLNKNLTNSIIQKMSGSQSALLNTSSQHQ